VGSAVAIGDGLALAGLALAGVSVVSADGAAEVRVAWDALASDVQLVILTPASAAALGDAVISRAATACAGSGGMQRLVVVTPV
jgi:hypothetical protein